MIFWMSKLCDDLGSQVDTHYRKNFLRFFTDHVNCMGVRKEVALVIGKKHFTQFKKKPKELIFDQCQNLFKQNILELSGVACDWAYRCKKQYQKEDIHLFQSWLQKYVHDWATCDTFCATVLKAYFAQYPGQIEITQKWTTHQNPYVRRASAVALIYFEPGKHPQLRLSRAKELMRDENLYVQKGYGWMLKKMSQYFPNEVYDFVVLHKKVMPRLALRYAIEKLPKQLRAQAMRKD